ncbi:MAG: exodeoxyribonuclease VII large subunit [Desulfobacterales bacterium]
MTNAFSESESSGRRIFSVSELNAAIKRILEDRFPFIWVIGEISNFRIPASGHYYFTLKDDRSQVGAVMFRGQNRELRFKPEDGITIVGLGRISAYEPRGTYQIIFEYIEPKGIGALQVAFEQLKRRLSDEGLFDARFKKPIPFLPRRIGLITSPTGAVVHDVIHILFRRFPNVQLDIFPVKVQGDEAAFQIVDALESLNRRCLSDVIILARGGGSLEDLQAFNSEAVARAVFASAIPVISAVGHEVDVTISDFVADLRAPTPSAAAELAVPEKVRLADRISDLTLVINRGMYRYIEKKRQIVKELAKRIADPKKRVDDNRLRLDDLTIRLVHIMIRDMRQRRERCRWRHDSLMSKTPLLRVAKAKDERHQLEHQLLKQMANIYQSKWREIRECDTRLKSLDPKSILQRGYSITRTIPDARVVRDENEVAVDQQLEIVLAKGMLTCRVERKSADGKENV